MTRDELLATLRRLQQIDDPEHAHPRADDALLAFIDDDEVREAYLAIRRWYA